MKGLGNVLRAQVSLQFDDESLYDEFIAPHKAARTLNGIIVKCLSAYYYNESVRNLVDGGISGDTDSGISSIIDDIQSTLLLQGFAMQEMLNTLEEGAGDVTDILNEANEAMRGSGLARQQSTEDGKPKLLLDAGKVQTALHRRDIQQLSTSSVSVESVAILQTAVLKLAESLGNTEVVSLLSTDSNEVGEMVAITNEKMQDSNVSTNMVSEPEADEKYKFMKGIDVTSSMEVSDIFVESQIPAQETVSTVETEKQNNTGVDFFGEAPENADTKMDELLGSL